MNLVPILFIMVLVVIFQNWEMVHNLFLGQFRQGLEAKYARKIVSLKKYLSDLAEPRLRTRAVLTRIFLAAGTAVFFISYYYAAIHVVDSWVYRVFSLAVLIGNLLAWVRATRLVYDLNDRRQDLDVYSIDQEYLVNALNFVHAVITLMILLIKTARLS